MLTPKQRRALYFGAETPKGRKRLAYRYQVAMIIVVPSNIPLELQRESDGDNQTSEDTIELAQTPPVFEEGR